jgi:hypothetical protein
MKAVAAAGTSMRINRRQEARIQEPVLAKQDE